MKKIAFYVEGQTEQFFIKELIIAIAGIKNIHVELEKFAGKKNSSIKLLDLAHTPATPNYSALIYDCGGDESVKARMLEDCQRLFSVGYSRVIGLRDLYPLTDLAKLESTLQKVRPLPNNADIIIAVHEIEAWFLAEDLHYKCIDQRLDYNTIRAAAGFDYINDDLTLLLNPATDIDRIYKAVQKRYNKSKSNVEQTVKCLDYANLYINVKSKISKLNDIITVIDNFLT